ncbi:MAG: Proteasome subunit alpha type-2 [Watsoniomyces obsoletus]|nr:MAG: Proteasome subunit alpha type-2 [Watsoniomyces obsoletus]
MATLASMSSTTCCSAGGGHGKLPNGFACLHTIALLTGQVEPTVIGETTSLVAASLGLYEIKEQAKQELAMQKVDSEKLLAPASPENLNTNNTNVQEIVHVNGHQEEVVKIITPIPDALLASNNPETTPLRNSHESDPSTVSFLSTPELTPDGSITEHHSSSSPSSSTSPSRSPRHHHRRSNNKHVKKGNSEEKASTELSPTQEQQQEEEEDRFRLRRQQQFRRLQEVLKKRQQAQKQRGSHQEKKKKVTFSEPEEQRKEPIVGVGGRMSEKEEEEEIFDRPSKKGNPRIIQPPSFAIELREILKSGRLHPEVTKMFILLINAIYRIGYQMKPYINHDQEHKRHHNHNHNNDNCSDDTDSDDSDSDSDDSDDDDEDEENIQGMDKESIERIYELAEKFIHLYDKIRGEVRVRAEMISRAKLLLPKLETVVETEQLRTMLGIWKQQLKGAVPYPRDEINLFRQFCNFYDKTVYHFFRETHRQSPLPSHLAIAPHLDAIYAVVEDVAGLAEQYQRDLKALNHQIHRAERRLKSYEEADLAGKALNELIKLVDERIRKQGEEGVVQNRAVCRRS